MGKKTVALTQDQYENIIQSIKSGFTYINPDGIKSVFRPNDRLATALTLEAVLGLRISDIVNLHLDDIIPDGERYRLDITEQKTGKKRTFTVPNDIYNYITGYAYRNNIPKTELLFAISPRSTQKQLKIVADYLGLDNISTHSFRKLFATNVYNQSGYNIELVRQLLQHSNTAITQRYIGIQQKEIETALSNHVSLI